jgi:hypothetical protein
MFLLTTPSSLSATPAPTVSYPRSLPPGTLAVRLPHRARDARCGRGGEPGDVVN